MGYKEIETQAELTELMNENQEISSVAFQNLDFTTIENLDSGKTFNDCLFLGCTLPESINSMLSDNCLIFPLIEMPYNPFINKLYTRHTLLGDFKLGQPYSYEHTHDKVVYKHYISTGKESDNIKETLARRLHDHSITDALYDFLENYNEKKVVAIMGGHSLPRNDADFLEIALISKKLSELGYLMISGGGPGAMEATHVGAWMAGKAESELRAVINILSEAPTYKDELWLDKAFEALQIFPNSEFKSLGIPTWLYGHEPPTPFASHIAKYFANSVREDGLLTIAKGGIIFAPGSAGTIQEIFQEATQNHYLSFGYASPMVFFNSSYWSNNRPIYPLLEKLVEEKKYKNLILSKCDSCKEVIAEIKKFTEN